MLGIFWWVWSAGIAPKTDKLAVSTSNVGQPSKPDHVSVPILRRKPVLTRPTSNSIQIEAQFEQEALPPQSTLWIQVADDANFKDLLLNEKIPYPTAGSTVNAFRYAQHVWARLVLKDSNNNDTAIGDSVSLDAPP
jgi:hypothetical protein